MPEKETLQRARRDQRQGKSASTQAGEFVREEVHHIREGKHGARSTKQAIAIGLSKARRAGVKLTPQPGQRASTTKKGRTKRAAAPKKRGTRVATSPRRAKAAQGALEREGRRAASPRSLARHAKATARSRTAAERSAAARKGARTKAAEARSEAGRKAASHR